MTNYNMSNGLGRGLSSLIPQKNNKNSGSHDEVDILLGDNKDKVLKVDIEKIEVNSMQPRQNFTESNLDELAESIKKYGIIQPLVVIDKDGSYELIAGERRLRAAKKAGLDKVPVVIREAGEQEKLEVALVENIQRENLNPIETAMAYRKLVDEFNLTQDELAKRLAKSRSSVANTLRMLNLPDEIRQALIEGKIGEGHAKYLVGLESEEKQLNLFRKIIRNNLTVSDVAEEARKMGGTKAARIKINYADKDKEFALREFFGAKIEIKRKGRGGQIIIDFYSDDELGEIVEKVKR